MLASQTGLRSPVRNGILAGMTTEMTTNNDSAKAQTPDSADPNTWLEEYGDFLYRRALLLLGKPEAAEDLVQDTLLAAYQSQKSFRGDSSIKTWLATILKNRAIDYMRKAVRREIPTSFDETYDQESNDFTSWGIWKEANQKWSLWDQSGYDKLESQEFAGALLQCIEKLPGSQRNILKLRIFEEMPIEDLCKELELSPSNIGVILFRTRLALRSCLDANWFKKS